MTTVADVIECLRTICLEAEENRVSVVGVLRAELVVLLNEVERLRADGAGNAKTADLLDRTLVALTKHLENPLKARGLLDQFAALWTEHGQHDERHYRAVAAHNKTGHAIAMVSLIDETRRYLAAEAAEDKP